ncbi:glycine cleavage system protein GcvH [Thermoflavimicrobium daqui]|uniref:Glycine cleavage system H protein n=1 Tax=Thermoflavimicrobium daqui TaxID=2137476 RepID=A0A364K2T0_9BACL|nr:glycine cleavage system protein GcvH [Thermoflavimicrobium daqui]RAL22706.1 glycine cleavage system protein GcvH [Thermoflavimicrobium daqui]
MSQVKENLIYSKEHEWVQVLDDDTVRIGISDFAQDQLGEIVFLELPEVDSEVEAHTSIGSVESVKAVSDLYCPVSGVVTKVNELLVDSPEVINDDPFGEGWMFEVKLSNLDELKELLSADQYKEFIEGE